MLSGVILFFELLATASFAISGAMTGIRKNMDIFGVLILGVVTATGGGILRDVLAGMTPYIFSKQFYLTASLIGALVCMIIWELVPDTVTWHYVAMGTGAVIIFILRMFAAHFRWDLPKPWKDEVKH